MLPNVLFLVVSVFCLQDTTAQYVQTYQRRYYVQRQPVIIYPSGSAVSTAVVEQPKLYNDKVQIDVYYETDCPDSMRFITTQLYPVYQQLEDIMEIKLVPYGKAWETLNPISKKYDYRCQHGPSECYGNTVQSCAISQFPAMKDKMNFINCMEAYSRPSQSAQKCARRLSMDWDKIEKCASGDEGNRLLHVNSQLTNNLQPKMYFVPWIVINKVFSERTQRLAQRDLKSVICDAYKGPTLSACGKR